MVTHPWQTTRPGLRVWALEPYCGGSHKHFLRGLALASEHEFELFTLPGRHWKWRMHGGALSLAAQTAERLRGEDRRGRLRHPDVLFVSDMLDLPTFRGLVGPPLDRVPTVLYFHENQLTYPLPEGVERDLGYGMRNLVSATAATRVLFNSEYHRAEFLAAAQHLLASMPDEVPVGILDGIRAKSRVLPVGCDLRRFDEHRERALIEASRGRWGDPGRGPLLVWNQRWEYDKAPGALFAGLCALKERGVPFRLALAGSGEGAPTQEFLRARHELDDHIVHWGRVEQDSDYAALLWAADVVVSTAIHEFFGIAVVEAVYCGCRPVLPHRLSYPELIPASVHEDVLYREGGLVEALERALARPHAWSEEWQRTWVARFDWAGLGQRYDAEIRRCRDLALESPGAGKR